MKKRCTRKLWMSSKYQRSDPYLSDDDVMLVNKLSLDKLISEFIHWAGLYH
jgi:hypothetical protein